MKLLKKIFKLLLPRYTDIQFYLNGTVMNDWFILMAGLAILQFTFAISAYKEAKEILIASILAFVGPMKEKYDHLQSHPKEVEEILAVGGADARVRAQETMSQVRALIGLPENK